LENAVSQQKESAAPSAEEVQQKLKKTVTTRATRNARPAACLDFTFGLRPEEVCARFPLASFFAEHNRACFVNHAHDARKPVKLVNS
jgi:hypothetical protein